MRVKLLAAVLATAALTVLFVERRTRPDLEDEYAD